MNVCRSKNVFGHNRSDSNNNNEASGSGIINTHHIANRTCNINL